MVIYLMQSIIQYYGHFLVVIEHLLNHVSAMHCMLDSF